MSECNKCGAVGAHVLCYERKVPRREAELASPCGDEHADSRPSCNRALPELPAGWTWVGDGPNYAKRDRLELVVGGNGGVIGTAKLAWCWESGDFTDFHAFLDANRVSDAMRPTAPHPAPATFADALDKVLGELRGLLLAKNAAYGNSVLEPMRVFSKASPLEQIRVRIDDKLSRLARGTDAGEDTKQDLLGYLVIEQVAKRLGGGE